MNRYPIESPRSDENCNEVVKNIHGVFAVDPSREWRL